MPTPTKPEIQAQLDEALSLHDALLEDIAFLNNENYQLTDLHDKLVDHNIGLIHERNFISMAVDQLATDLHAIIQAADESLWIPPKLRKAIDAVRERFVEEDDAEPPFDELNDVDLSDEGDGVDFGEELAEWEKELLASAKEVGR